jgi:hypothetical protein
MLSEADRSALLEVETWLIFVQDVARRELTGQALASEEYRRLAEYGRLIAKLSTTAAGAPADGQQEPGSGCQSMVAVPVAANGLDQRIEAVGPVGEIYVVVERGRERYLTRGGVYSHYEFAWPIGETLTDVLWREMISSGEVPAQPMWVDAFTVR